MSPWRRCKYCFNVWSYRIFSVKTKHTTIIYVLITCLNWNTSLHYTTYVRTGVILTRFPWRTANFLLCLVQTNFQLIVGFVLFVCTTLQYTQFKFLLIWCLHIHTDRPEFTITYTANLSHSYNLYSVLTTLLWFLYCRELKIIYVVVTLTEWFTVRYMPNIRT
jgi:hypothetical protein